MATIQYDLSGCECCSPCDCDGVTCPEPVDPLPATVNADMGTGWANADCSNCATVFDGLTPTLNKAGGVASAPFGYAPCCPWSYIGAGSTLTCGGSLEASEIILFPAYKCSTGEWYFFMSAGGNLFISPSLGMSPDFTDELEAGVSFTHFTTIAGGQCDGSGVVGMDVIA